MVIRFPLIPERYGQTDRRTDGRTDRQNCYINIARQYADAIKSDHCSSRVIQVKKLLASQDTLLPALCCEHRDA